MTEIFIFDLLFTKTNSKESSKCICFTIVVDGAILEEWQARVDDAGPGVGAKPAACNGRARRRRDVVSLIMANRIGERPVAAGQQQRKTNTSKTLA